ncbi:MAG: PEGA domain-containing protein [Kofleriaceae bacterium]
MTTAWARLAALGVWCVLFGAPARAAAEPMRRVSIETEPAGATVYLGEKEAGAAGVTPVVLDLEVGEHVIILELDGYVPKFETVEVPKAKGKTIKAVFRLDRGNGTLVVQADGAAKGAKVLIDDEERGVAPSRYSLESGGHRVEVIADGKTIFADTVDIRAGQETTVSARGRRGGGKRRPRRDVADRDARESARDDRPDRDDDRAERELALRVDDDERADRADRADQDDDPEATSISATSGSARSRQLHVAPLIEVGYRSLDYSAIASPANTPSLRQRGAVLLGARVEAAPLRSLPGLTLTAAGGYGIPQTLTTSQGTSDSIWWRVEALASYRVRLGDRLGLLALGGYEFSRFKFFGTPQVRALVPDASYSMARLGIGLSARTSGFEISAVVENRPVLSGGMFTQRFRNPSADGLAARLGVVTDVTRRYYGGLDASFARYAWSFSYEVTDTYRARGASDVLVVVAARAGASF